MPVRRRPDPDPRIQLVRAIDRLSERRQYVTLEDVGRAAARWRSNPSADDLAALVEGAVAESILLKDLRTFYDRKTGTFAEHWVYRVNPRHPVVTDLLESD